MELVAATELLEAAAALGGGRAALEDVDDAGNDAGGGGRAALRDADDAGNDAGGGGGSPKSRRHWWLFPPRQEHPILVLPCSPQQPQTMLA